MTEDRRKADRRITLFGSGRHRAANPINNSSRRNTQDRRQSGEAIDPARIVDCGAYAPINKGAK